MNALEKITEEMKIALDGYGIHPHWVDIQAKQLFIAGIKEARRATKFKPVFLETLSPDDIAEQQKESFKKLLKKLS